MKKYTATLQDNAGNAISSQDVNVYFTGTTNPAALFNDFGNPMSNPQLTDTNGQVSFRVFSGTYDLVDDSGNPYQTGVQIYDMQNQSEWVAPATSGKSPFFIGSSGQLGDFPGSGPGQIVLQQLGCFEIFSNGNTAPGGDTLLKIIAGASYPSPYLLMASSGFAHPLFVFTTPGLDSPMFLLSDGSFDATTGTCGFVCVDSATVASAGNLESSGSFATAGPNLGFNGATPIGKPTVTGVKTDLTNAGALKHLLTALANLGLITDSTT